MPFIVDIIDVLVVLGHVVAVAVGCMADGLLTVVVTGAVSWERIILDIASLRQQLAFCTGLTPE